MVPPELYPELHLAAYSGDVAKVSSLLANGVPANIRGTAGRWTALHIAAGQGHVATMEVLLEARADCTCTDGDGCTPAEWADWYGHGHAAMALHNRENVLRHQVGEVGKSPQVVQDPNDRADMELLRNEAGDARARLASTEMRSFQLERELERASAANVATRDRAVELERQLQAARATVLAAENRIGVLEKQLQDSALHREKLGPPAEARLPADHRIAELEAQLASVEQIRQQDAARLRHQVVQMEQELAEMSSNLALQQLLPMLWLQANAPKLADVIGRVALGIARGGLDAQESLAELQTGSDGLPFRAALERLLKQVCKGLPENELQLLLTRFSAGDVDTCDFVKGLMVGRPVVCTSRVRDIIVQLATAMAKRGMQPEEVFAQGDGASSEGGILTLQELEAMLRRLQPNLSERELKLLFAHFDGAGSGQVKVSELIAALQAGTPDGILARIATAMKRVGKSIEELFVKTDANRDGSLSVSEIERLLLKVQPDLSELERLHLFSRFDRDGSGEVDIGEFCRALSNARARPRAVASAHAKDVITRMAASLARLGKSATELFGAADVNGDGRVTHAELDDIVMQMQPDLSAQDRRELFRSFDADNNGEVDLAEFCRVLEGALEQEMSGAGRVMEEAMLVEQLRSKLRTESDELAATQAECQDLRSELAAAVEETKTSRDRAAAAARAWGR